jgi:hypothetical protein
MFTAQVVRGQALVNPQASIILSLYVMIIAAEPTESGPRGDIVVFRYRRLSIRGSTTRAIALGMLFSNDDQA